MESRPVFENYLLKSWTVRRDNLTLAQFKRRLNQLHFSNKVSTVFSTQDGNKAATSQLTIGYGSKTTELEQELQEIIDFDRFTTIMPMYAKYMIFEVVKSHNGLNVFDVMQDGHLLFRFSSVYGWTVFRGNLYVPGSPCLYVFDFDVQIISRHVYDIGNVVEIKDICPYSIDINSRLIGCLAVAGSYLAASTFKDEIF